MIALEQGVGGRRLDEEAVMRPSDVVSAHDVVDRGRGVGLERGDPDARKAGAVDEVAGDQVVVAALERDPDPAAVRAAERVGDVVPA